MPVPREARPRPGFTLPGCYSAKQTGRREACCLPTVWLANPGPQELPDLLGGLGCLGGAEHDLVDVG
jgi:hypothetical protein